MEVPFWSDVGTSCRICWSRSACLSSSSTTLEHSTKHHQPNRVCTVEARLFVFLTLNGIGSRTGETAVLLHSTCLLEHPDAPLCENRSAFSPNRVFPNITLNQLNAAQTVRTQLPVATVSTRLLLFMTCGSFDDAF